MWNALYKNAVALINKRDSSIAPIIEDAWSEKQYGTVLLYGEFKKQYSETINAYYDIVSYYTQKELNALAGKDNPLFPTIKEIVQSIENAKSEYGFSSGAMWNDFIKGSFIEQSTEDIPAVKYFRKVEFPVRNINKEPMAEYILEHTTMLAEYAIDMTASQLQELARFLRVYNEYREKRSALLSQRNKSKAAIRKAKKQETKQKHYQILHEIDNQLQEITQYYLTEMLNIIEDNPWLMDFVSAAYYYNGSFFNVYTGGGYIIAPNPVEFRTFLKLQELKQERQYQKSLDILKEGGTFIVEKAYNLRQAIYVNTPLLDVQLRNPFASEKFFKRYVKDATLTAIRQVVFNDELLPDLPPVEEAESVQDLNPYFKAVNEYANIIGYRAYPVFRLQFNFDKLKEVFPLDALKDLDPKLVTEEVRTYYKFNDYKYLSRLFHYDKLPDKDKQKIEEVFEVLPSHEEQKKDANKQDNEIKNVIKPQPLFSQNVNANNKSHMRK